MENFLRAIQEEERRIKAVLANPKAMRMTPEDRRMHNASATCHVCDKPLNGDTVRDHCHITGKYRGAAHNVCNLKLRLNPKTTPIPVVFHNLRGYDSHLLMQAISKVEGRISCIPNNTEKYISFSLRAAALYRQRPVPAGVPGQARGSQPARDLPDYDPV